MFKYWIRKNIIFNLITFFSFIVFCFFMSHIFFGNRSVWKIFELNHRINVSKQELIILSNKKNYTLSEIELLRDDNLDPDMISEIVQNSLGLIHSDQIVIEVPK